MTQVILKRKIKPKIHGHTPGYSEWCFVCLQDRVKKLEEAMESVMEDIQSQHGHLYGDMIIDGVIDIVTLDLIEDALDTDERTEAGCPTTKNK